MVYKESWPDLHEVSGVWRRRRRRRRRSRHQQEENNSEGDMT
jgi:hypothetical protein